MGPVRNHRFGTYFDNGEELEVMNSKLFFGAFFKDKEPSLLEQRALLDAFSALPRIYAMAIGEMFTGHEPRLVVDVAEAVGLNYFEADQRICAGMRLLRRAVRTGMFRDEQLPFTHRRGERFFDEDEDDL